jgi:hypothetical protein
MLKSFRTGIFLGLGLLTMTALAGPALAFGSLALSDDGASGWSHNFSSKGRADEAALEQCGPGCRIVVQYWNGCGAYAADGDGSDSASGWGTGTSRRAAEGKAVSECQGAGGDTCDVKVWACE